jgi:hypothetical protein
MVRYLTQMLSVLLAQWSYELFGRPPVTNLNGSYIMAKVMFEMNGIVSLDSIDSEEDLKPSPGIRGIINRPPKNGRCDCCGRHLSELKPFCKAGDPVLDDLEGALLVKRFRECMAPDRKFDAIWGIYTWNCESEEDYRKAKERMIQELGEEEAELIDAYPNTTKPHLYIREMGSKFNPWPWNPRLEVIQVNESYETRIPIEAQKSRKRLERNHRGYTRSLKFEAKMTPLGGERFF